MRLTHEIVLTIAFLAFPVVGGAAQQPADASQKQPAVAFLKQGAAVFGKRTAAVQKAERESRPQNLTWMPEELVNGAPCIFRYQPAEPLSSLSGSWMGRKVFFHPDEVFGGWIGFAGVDYDAAPGVHVLEVSGTAKSGTRLAFSTEVRVGAGAYRSSAITVAPKYVEPDPKDLARIAGERELKSELFGKVTDRQLWKGTFLAPVSSEISSEFGSQRTYNGKRQSVHQGLDFAAAKGTPVSAINGGKIILAREMYFEGNCVVVDHGQGLLSLYLHLSEIKVKEGAAVIKGQLVGISGATGRVTGPHLHLAVRWQGLYLNPETLLRMKLD